MGDDCQYYIPEADASDEDRETMIRQADVYKRQLYLDGELTAVCSDGTALQSYLSSLLEPYEDPENSNVTVG